MAPKLRHCLVSLMNYTLTLRGAPLQCPLQTIYYFKLDLFCFQICMLTNKREND